MSNYIEETEKKKKKKALAFTGVMLGTMLAVEVPLVIHCADLAEKQSKISWEALKNSHIIVTEEDNSVNYHIVGDFGDYKNYDLINDYIVDSKRIIYQIDTAPYLVNKDNVKRYYTKEELKEVLNEFKMNEEYTTSDETVKVLTK